MRYGQYSYEGTKERFENTFKITAPTKVALSIKLVSKFQATGQVTDQNKVGSGRPRTARSEDNINRVREKTQRSPKKKLNPSIPKSSIYRILRVDLNLIPYRIKVKQTLSLGDKQERVLLCRAALAKHQLDPHWFDNIMVYFQLCGHVNSKNMVFWGIKHNPPEEVAERPLHSEKLTAISKQEVIEPYFFWEHHQTVTVKKECYVTYTEDSC